MTVTMPELRGPIDFVLLEFPGDRPAGGGAEALLALVEQGTIALYDLRVIEKDPDGSVRHLDLAQAGPAAGDLARLAWGESGLLDDEDLEQAAQVLEPGTRAVLVVYENTWAIPFVTAAWRAGGRLVASARLAEQDVTRALDAQDAQDARDARDARLTPAATSTTTVTSTGTGA